MSVGCSQAAPTARAVGIAARRNRAGRGGVATDGAACPRPTRDDLLVAGLSSFLARCLWFTRICAGDGLEKERGGVYIYIRDLSMRLSSFPERMTDG